MSYCDENGKVTLMLSREDFNFLVLGLGVATGRMLKEGEKVDRNGLWLNG